MLVASRRVWELRPLPGVVLNLFVGETAVNEACSSGDELADNHVLFQTKERIGCGTNRRACQHFDRVLEGGS